MNAMYGDIEELYREVSGSDILSEPDKQKKLNEIQLQLSTLKKQREIAKSKVRHQMRTPGEVKSAPVTKIEITSLPEVRIRKEEENITKYGLKSIHLVTDSLEPSNAIFLVLDGWFENPIRCTVKNHQGEATFIKKLYDIAYLVNVPGKKVGYDRNLADNVNNGLFKIKRVAEYIRTNKFKKPTLVKKSGEILVLANEVIVKTELITNIPAQYQSLYIDKTK